MFLKWEDVWTRVARVVVVVVVVLETSPATYIMTAVVDGWPREKWL